MFFNRNLRRLILYKLNQIIMTQAEVAQAINDASDRIQKGIDEVKKAVANSGNSTPEIDAAITRLQGYAKDLDEINPDEPPTT